MGEKGQATEVPPNTEVASVGPSSGGLPNVGPRGPGGYSTGGSSTGGSSTGGSSTGAGGSTPRPDKDPA